MTILQHLLVEYSNQQYKPDDVHSKLTAFNNPNLDNNPKDTVAFGLEDSNGETIKVYVKSDQAQQFEATINRLFSEYDENDPYAPEIAELLFQLKDQFDIVNIEWPKFVEDEENLQPLESNASPENIENDPTLPEEPSMKDPTTDLSGDSEKQLFNSLLQTMMADAEAKRQEALAKAAEARAREAEAAAKMADNKLKAEEEVADMEAFYDIQNAEKKEAKKLAKLAKYRHTVKQQQEDTGKFDLPDDALDQLDTDSSSRMDQPSGKNPPGTEPGLPPIDNEEDLSTPLDQKPTGFENEERDTSSNTYNNMLQQTNSLLNMLYKLRGYK